MTSPFRTTFRLSHINCVLFGFLIGSFRYQVDEYGATSAVLMTLFIAMFAAGCIKIEKELNDEAGRQVQRDD